MPKREELEGSHYLLAHRGGSMEAPENTLQSFQHSARLGVHVIETDVQITSDGVIIVAHDFEFDRLCKPETMKGKKQLVRDTLSTELPKFKEEMPLHFSGASYKRNEDDQDTYTPLE